MIVGMCFTFQNDLNAQVFEGELIYSCKVIGVFTVAGREYNMEEEMIRQGDFFDTLTILYKGNKYKKTKNKKRIEQDYFDLGEEKSITRFGKNKKIIVDDLSFNDLINQPCHPIGTIQKIETKDTFYLNSLCKYIELSGEVGNEKYIISESLPKLNFNRNILQDESCQIYQKEVGEIINNSIVLNYELEFPETNVVVSFSLERKSRKKLKEGVVTIPAYKEKGRDKKSNKSSKRIKSYTLIEE
jgi:hypothetical protein